MVLGLRQFLGWPRHIRYSRHFSRNESHSLASRHAFACIRFGCRVLLVGVGLRRDHEWRAFGVHSLIASVAAAVLIVLMNMAFMPDAALWELASRRARRTGDVY